MLFAENDAPLLKAWIVNRLANTSDADADVLADYVLALLRHDGDVGTIRKLFEEEIPDFLREDAGAFTDDVFQAVNYRSYLPGAPPPPPITRQTLPPPAPATAQFPRPEYQPSFPSYPTAPAAAPLGPSGSRKRAYDHRDDNDVDIILTSTDPWQGHQPYKQPRRGGGFSQRGGRYDDPYGMRGSRGGPGPGPGPSPYPMLQGPGRFGTPPGPGRFGQPPPFPPHHHAQGMVPIDPNSIIENIQRLQQLLPQASNLNLPQPVYSGPAIPPPRQRKPRCRDFDKKGYCSRGSKCNYDHGSEPFYAPPFVPSARDEYDPNNASLPLPNVGNQPLPQALQPMDMSAFQMMTPANRREPKKPKRIKGRAPFAVSGPMHNKSNTTIVVQHIPKEHFSDDQIRDYFSQFGNILHLSLQPHNYLAIIKFDTWDSANAAFRSPKVIFDNRFVKVFWHKEGDEALLTTNGKHANGTQNGAQNGTASGHAATGDDVSAEPEFDLEEFNRKQEEAQRIHEEKTRKRQELERQRQELEEREKELHARQLEEKRKLQAKLAANGVRDNSSSPAEIRTEGPGKNSGPQTEALRAKLAALEDEANVLGIDADATPDEFSWPPRGRGRGRGYRGRGSFPPRAFRGSYGSRGRGGVEARHAAYAAYSLDNRPKIIALSGVDFTSPEKDEALRQYLFNVGEYKDIHTDPTTTHITFKDRKIAEQFMFGVSATNTIPGIDDKLEISWSTTAPQSDSATNADGDLHMASGLEDEQAAKTSIAGSSATAGLEEGEIDHDQGDMDYEAGEEWGIS